MRSRSVALAGLALLGGCFGSDVDGMYEIDSHTESLAGSAPATCWSEGPPVPPAYLQLSRDDTTLSWKLCDTPDAGSCRGTNPMFDFYDVDGEWTANAARMTSTGIDCEDGCLLDCNLAHASGAVTEESSHPLSIRLEIQFWQASKLLADDQCTIEAAYDLAENDACARHTVITATRL